jgi:hypothetical protein
LLIAALIATSGCTSYLVVAPEPRHAGQEHHRGITSLAGGTGTSPHPGVVASECGDGEQLAMVRLTRNFGQSLLSVLSLGLYAPATAHYFCASPPQPPGGEIDTSGGG